MTVLVIDQGGAFDQSGTGRRQNAQGIAGIGTRADFAYARPAQRSILRPVKQKKNRGEKRCLECKNGRCLPSWDALCRRAAKRPCNRRLSGPGRGLLRQLLPTPTPQPVPCLGRWLMLPIAKNTRHAVKGAKSTANAFSNTYQTEKTIVALRFGGFFYAKFAALPIGIAALNSEGMNHV